MKQLFLFEDELKLFVQFQHFFVYKHQSAKESSSAPVNITCKKSNVKNEFCVHFFFAELYLLTDVLLSALKVEEF